MTKNVEKFNELFIKHQGLKSYLTDEERQTLLDLLEKSTSEISEFVFQLDSDNKKDVFWFLTDYLINLAEKEDIMIIKRNNIKTIVGKKTFNKIMKKGIKSNKKSYKKLKSSMADEKIFGIKR